MGTLLEISEKTISPQAIPEILAGMDRSRAGRTAPAQGLYLDHVEYGGRLPGEKLRNKKDFSTRPCLAAEAEKTTSVR